MGNCGPYQLIEHLGSGSSGKVYRAQKQETTEPERALKLLAEPPSPLWLGHLKALSAHQSPYLCQFLESAHDESMGHYVVYQLLEGGDLEVARQRYEEGRVPLRTTLRWGIDALKGLDTLHKAGFLHGDIKPSNLMLDKQGQVVVCDFTTLTPLQGELAFELLSGTPEYLPKDDALLRTPQRDLYALALTLMGLLLGKLPEVSSKSPPSQLDPLLPTALDTIIARAMGWELPFPTASEMRSALEGLLGSPEPVSVTSNLSPPTRRVEMQAPISKKPLWPWLVALLMLPTGALAHSLLSPPTTAQVASTALWSGVGVAPAVVEQQAVWQVLILGRPVLGFSADDPAANNESARERAEWCAAVLEEAHFLKRPLHYDFRRELEHSCDVYLVGEGWDELFLFRVTAAESRLYQRKGPFLARAWCALISDTAELARPGARGEEKGPSSFLLQPWQRRFETLAGQSGSAGLDQPARIHLWLDALESLEGQAYNELVNAYRDLPQESSH